MIISLQLRKRQHRLIIFFLYFQVISFYNNDMNLLKIKSKKLYIAGGALLLLLVAGLGLLISKQSKKAAEQTLNLAFYNLPEKVTKALEEDISKAGFTRVHFKNLSLEEIISEKTTKNFDMIFTFDGVTAANLKDKGANFSGKLFNMIPTSLRRENEEDNKKALPILLDHFEFSYNNPISQKIGMENPQTFDQLLKYLEAAKKYAFTPFFTNGGHDEILLGLISCLIEAKGGYDAYSDFVKNVRKNPSLENIINLKLGKAGQVSLAEVLKLLRSWAENGIVHPNWYYGKYRDVIAFIEDGQVALLFTKLSVHRTIPYKLIRNFSTERAPVQSASVDHAVIAPAIYAVKLSRKSINDKVLLALLSEDGQSSLSMKTQLGPVALRGESYDVQADDVRFFAASCRYGSRPGILLDAFTPASESSKKLCEGIRSYLSSGRY